MEKKYKQKKKTEEEYLKELEKVNFETALEARRTLDSITRTTERTSAILYEQREKFEEIRGEADTIQDNLAKGKELSVKMKRAGKLITIGDKIGDKIKEIFKSTPSNKETYKPKTNTNLQEQVLPSLPDSEDSPTEDSTNKVLLSIRDGLKDLHTRLITQNEEINEQIPLIKDIIKINKNSTEEADNVMKNLKRI